LVIEQDYRGKSQMNGQIELVNEPSTFCKALSLSPFLMYKEETGIVAAKDVETRDVLRDKALL
jgi:hypothetical protein